MDESLDLFVSENAWKQWERLHQEAQQATDEMATLSETAKTAFADLGGTDTLAQLINLTAKATQANKDMAQVTVTLNTAYENFGRVIGLSTGNMTSNIQQLIEGKNALNATKDSISSLNEKMKEGKITQDDYYTKMTILEKQLAENTISVNEYKGALNNEIKATSLASAETQKLTLETLVNKNAVQQNNVALKDQIKLQQAIPGSIAEARIQSAMWRKELINLNLTTDEGITKQKELIAMIGERDAFIKSNVDAYTAQKINIGNYPDATAQLAALNAEMEALKATGGEDSEAMVMLAGKAAELKTAMGGVAGELSIVTKSMQEMAAAGLQDSEIYQQLTQRAIELKTAQKEVQSTINSGTAGVTPFVNNNLTTQLSLTKTKMLELAVAGKEDSAEFRELQMEAQRLTAALNEVNVSIKGVTSIGDKFTNILQRMGLRFIANLVIFQAAMELFTELSDRWEKAYKRQNIVEQSMIDMNTKAADTFAESAAKMESYRSRFNDVASSISDKKEVVKDLNNAFEDQIGHINGINDAEKFFRDKSAAFIEATKLRAEAMGAMGVIQDKTKENMINQASGGSNLINGFDAILASAKGALTSGNPVSSGIQLVTDATAKLKDETEANNKAIDYATKKYKELSDAALKLDKANGFDTDPVKSKKGKTDQDYTLKEEQQLTKELYTEYAKRMEFEANLQKAIVDDEASTYQERIEAFKKYNQLMMQSKSAPVSGEYSATQESLGKISQIEQKPAKQRTNQDKELLASKEVLEQKLNNLYQEGVNIRLEYAQKEKDGLKKLDEDHFNSQLSVTKTMDDHQKQLQGAALEELNKQYKEGNITYEKYAKERQDMQDRFARSSLLLNEAYYNELIKKMNPDNPNIQKLKDLLAEVKAELAKLDAADIDKKHKADDKPVSGPFSTGAFGKSTFGGKDKDGETSGMSPEAAKAANETVMGLQAGISLEKTLTDAMNQRYQLEIENIEKKKALIDKAYEADINAVNGSLASEQKKAAAIMVLTAQKAAADQAAHAQEVALKRKMAKDDKVANTTSVIEKTALAVITSLADVPWPLNIVMAALAAATGAVELGTILSAPLPQYRYGTEDHPGGRAILGDAFKRELVLEPGKAPYWSSDKPIVYDLAKHTRVIPESDLINDTSGMMDSDILNYFQVQMGIENAISNSMGEVGSKIDNLADVMRNKPETKLVMKNGEWQKSIKRGHDWHNYLERNF